MRPSTIGGKFLALALPLIFTASAVSANETFRIDPAHSKITFKVRHLLGTAEGKFGNFSGTIALDREHPENSNVRAVIKVRSIDTGIAKRDAHMCGPDFFDVGKFPEIIFQSRQTRPIGKEKAEVSGDFTMHGVTRTIPLRVELRGFSPDGKTSRWHVTTEPIKRSDYGLLWGETTERISMISQQVLVDLEIEARAER
ncbi:MAG: YceI family protein [Chthoniobacterales bacterium]